MTPFFNNLALTGGCLLLLFLIIGLVFIRPNAMVIVRGFFWTRKVVLGHEVWVAESSYFGYPEESRNHQCTTERYQSYQVINYQTTTTMINGQPITSTRPIYGFVWHTRKKYTYEIPKWVVTRELLAEGDDRISVHWPEYELDTSIQESQGWTEETYLVLFQTKKGKIYKVSLPEEDWMAIHEGDVYRLRVSLFGKVFQVQKGE